MKTQYLRISITAVFFAALIFGTSCKKKSSDSVAPATTTPVATSTKPAAPNTAKRETTAPVDGTGRPPLTDIPVAGGVTVQDQENQRKDMTVANQGKLDGLTGRGISQGRFEGDPARTDFGWIVADMTVNGEAYSDNKIQNDGLQSILFFNIDSSGYYWQFDTDSSKWSWGTYGIDTAMTTIAFDFDGKNNPNQVWKIAKITKDRFVISGEFDVIEEITGPIVLEKVVIGFNAFDLTDPAYSGETEPVVGQEKFVGNWNQYIEEVVPTTDPNDPDYPNNHIIYTANGSKLYVNADGTYEISSMSGGQISNSNGSWVLESIPSTDSTQAPVYYLYPTYYDAETSTIKTDTYVMSIEGKNMVMVKITNPQPTNPETLYFQRPLK